MSQDDLNAFDAMPAPIRSALRDSRFPISSKSIADLQARGLTVSEVVNIVREVDRRMVNDAQWNLDFWGF
jgi:hypothetical protein